jgi:hypothetical protein
MADDNNDDDDDSIFLHVNSAWESQFQSYIDQTHKWWRKEYADVAQTLMYIQDIVSIVSSGQAEADNNAEWNKIW